jgi:hypothetical protein
MPWFAVVMIALLAANAAATLATVGEPREPITPALALFTLLADGLFIWAIVSLAS